MIPALQVDATHQTGPHPTPGNDPIIVNFQVSPK
jgi:hypothetical protein